MKCRKNPPLGEKISLRTAHQRILLLNRYTVSQLNFSHLQALGKCPLTPNRVYLWKDRESSQKVHPPPTLIWLQLAREWVVKVGWRSIFKRQRMRMLWIWYAPCWEITNYRSWRVLEKRRFQSKYKKWPPTPKVSRGREFLSGCSRWPSWRISITLRLPMNSCWIRRLYIIHYWLYAGACTTMRSDPSTCNFKSTVKSTNARCSNAYQWSTR